MPVTFTRAPAPQGTTTTTVVTVPGGQAETPAATPLTLSLERVRSARVDRRGDFIVTTNTTGRGVLVGKGTTSGGGKRGACADTGRRRQAAACACGYESARRPVSGWRPAGE